MAFSAFRLMMGAGASSGPVVLTDTITAEVACLIWNQGSSNNYCINQLSLVDQTGTEAIVYGVNNAGGYATYQPTLNSAGPSLTIGTPLSVGSSTATAGSLDISYNSAQGIVAANNGSSNQNATVAWINSGNTSVSSTVNHATGVTITASRVNAVSGGTLTVVMTKSASASDILLFDQSGTQYDSSVAGPTDISTQMSSINLTSTLGVVIYNNSSNLIKLVTYNISGSTISIDSAVSSTITATSGAKATYIDSSHILFVYKKTTDTLGARVVTVATGSTFTFGTEYTATATGITDDPIGLPGQFSSGDYGVTWINAAGQGCCTLMSVSGTTITLSNPIIYHTANDVIATTDYYSSYFAGISSTQAIIGYMFKSKAVSSQTALTKAVTVDLNFSQSSNKWNSTWTGNLQVKSSGVATTQVTDMDSLGTDRYIYISTTNSTSVLIGTIDNDYSTALSTNHASLTAAASVGTSVGNIVNIGVSGNTARAIAVYGYSNTTIQAVLVQAAQDGTITNGTPSTVDSSASTTTINSMNTINYATDKTLVLWTRSNGIYGSIITTSGTTISSISSPTLVYSVTTGSVVYLGVTNLGSNNIMFTYGQNGSGSGIAGIISISGSTITLGSTVNIGTNNTGTISSCQLSSGSGVFSFMDQPASDGEIYVQGFTYSGTTITLGGATHNVSQAGTTLSNNPTNYKTNILHIGNTDTLVSYYGYDNETKVRLVTSNGINSFTIGSEYSTGVNLNYSGWLPQDSYSKATLYFGASTGLANCYRV